MNESPLVTDYRIEAPHFVARVTVDRERQMVTGAAPICVYMIGWTEQRMLDYARRKGWDIQRMRVLEVEDH